MDLANGTLTVHVVDAVQLPVVNHLGESHLQRVVLTLAPDCARILHQYSCKLPIARAESTSAFLTKGRLVSF